MNESCKGIIQASKKINPALLKAISVCHSMITFLTYSYEIPWI